MKTLACRDAGMNCDYVAKGETMEELKKNSMDHVAAEHPDKVEEVKGMTDEQMMGMVKEM